MNRRNEPRPAGRSSAPPDCWRAARITALLSAPALLLALWPAAAMRMQYDRMAIAGGEWWRVPAAHWTHWTADHLLWDVTAFAVLLYACWRLDRGRTAAALAGASIAIPAAVWIAQPQMTHYRGLSGLDSTLFVLLAVTLLGEAIREADRAMSVAVAVALAGFAGKVVFELTTGSTLFVSAEGFAPVPLAHAVGGLCGWIATRPVALRVAD